MSSNIKSYDFFKTKYGDELLIDLIRLEQLESYIKYDDGHKLSYYDITIVNEGNGNFYLDDECYIIESGAVFFTSPGQVRKWEIDKIPNAMVLIFEEAFICSFFQDIDFVRKLPFFNSIEASLKLNDTNKEKILSVFQDIEAEILDFKSTNSHVLRALLYQVLAKLEELFLDSSKLGVKPTNRHIIEFRNLVEENYSKHHAVAYYADQLHITSGHLNDLSKKYLNLPAKRYISGKLVLEAKRKIISSKLSIKEISEHLGFSDSSYFIRFFKKNTGKTPSVFQMGKP